jgi:hypothetical protein
MYDRSCAASTYTSDGANTGSTVSTATNYAKQWFNEPGYTSLDTCTHKSEFDEDVLKVKECKKHVTEATCEAEGTNGICYYKVFEDTTCNGGATGTAFTTGDTVANCFAQCTSLATCDQFWFSGTAGADSCKVFSP